MMVCVVVCIVWECFERKIARACGEWRMRLWARIDQIFAPSVIFVSCTGCLLRRLCAGASYRGRVGSGEVGQCGEMAPNSGQRGAAQSMSYGYMKKEVERLREEIEALVTQAYNKTPRTTQFGQRRGDELPRVVAP